MFRALVLVLEIAFLGAIWALVGWLLLPRRFRDRLDPLLRWTTAFGLGTGANSVVLTAMAALHVLHPTPVRGLILLQTIVALATAMGGRHVVWASLALMLAMTLVATLAPPSAMDATLYHLRVPNEFLRSGTWSKLEQVQSFQPLYIEMLFAEALTLGGAPLAALVHWLLGIGAMASAACWARRLGARRVWGALVFGATGLYVWEATSMFIDLGLALFASLSLFWAIGDELDVSSALLAGAF